MVVPPGLSPVHLLVIFAVALIVLGPDKMPEAVRKGARLLGEARQWSARISDEVQNAILVQSQAPSAPIADTSVTPSPGSTSNGAHPVTEPNVNDVPLVLADAEPIRAPTQASGIPVGSSEPDPRADHQPPVAKESS